MRNQQFAGAPKKGGPRVNRDIRETEVRLIGADGDNVGVVDIRKAMDMARDAGLDLVEVSPNVSPPVCKILDYGKFKYEQQKKASAARKKQKTVEVKEIKMRPNTDVHDFNVKMKKVHQFIEKGDKVKLTIRFRGREMAHQELGMEVLKRVEEEMKEDAKIEARPKMEGRQMMMILGPK
ncbi:translation initiation factor IF-3 [Temperatibacter marinus]|uniref:Translation initiation factor IF-3 n=1 Tax=Temperatibacter marinus TaxID=1456591 RepID=A0AA52EER1_9PROT|nr:translation initiation factor IF-3 [Temperatibacter marinus]WND04157.1 translation initiation factor IF-3 [Temperatibacter marinus]